MPQLPSKWIYVWDPFVRIFHWLLVIAFAVSYLTGDELLGLHVWSGYLIGILIVLRILWGFIGPTHARFRDFIYRPGAALRYFGSLLSFRSDRHLGHSPAGGVMVLALLLALSVTVVTGLIHYAAEEHSGPLAFLFSASADLPASGGGHEHESAGGFIGAIHEIHEVAANLTLFLVIVHIAAVLFASFAYRENLIRSMVTGYKRPL